MRLFGIIVLILFLLGILQSCGSRRSEVNIQKDSDKSTEKTVDKGEVSKESSTTDNSKIIEQLAKINEKKEQRIIELYDSLGRLKQRITENVSSKDSDNSKKEESRSYVTKLRVDSNFYTTLYKDRTITKYVKSKKVVSSNTGWIIAFTIMGLVALLFGYLYWKVRPKV